jgi:predicted transcriptional regulator YdeE
MVTKKFELIQDVVPVSSWNKFSFYKHNAVLPVRETWQKVFIKNLTSLQLVV